MPADIERIAFPGQEELRRRYIQPGRPVILTGLVDRWPAVHWTPASLAEKVGEKLVPVRSMQGGDYGNARSDNMTVRGYLERIGALDGGEAAAEDGAVMYLSEVSLKQYLPALLGDVDAPEFFPDEHPKASVIYIGQRLFSQLHYHPFGSATLCMCFGRKRVRLYAPDQTPYLYKYPFTSPYRNMSRTTSNTPDPQQFPDFARAAYLEFDVHAGEMLFIPIYYWHAIENMELNIATVFFWERSLRSRFLPPAGMRMEYLQLVASALPHLPRRVVGKLARMTSLLKKSA